MVKIIPYQSRPHECQNCGHVQDIATNHKEGCIDYCKKCSWKPSFGKGKAIPFGNNQAYREFKFYQPR